MATTKNCNVCGSPIPQSAKLCPVCKNYQGGWSKVFHSLLSSLPLWAAAAALVVWAFAQWPTVRIYFWPREDIQVIVANPLEGAVIVNRGDHEVFVSHISLYMTGRTSKWTAQRFPVDASVAAGKFLRVAAPRKDDFGLAYWVRGIEAAKWEKFVDEAVSDRQCFQILLFTLDDPFFRQTAESAGLSLNRLAAIGYVEYRTISAPTYTRKPLEATGVIRYKRDCQKKVSDLGGL